MLYLMQPADEASAGADRSVPVAQQTALRLERALLCGESAARQEAVFQAISEDRDLANWALRASELRLRRTVNRLEEAAEWLAGCLVSELASSLTSDGSVSELDVEWRLPALVQKLHWFETELHEFNSRLEREKLESLKELAYGASHEINNPLANIAARAQTLLSDEADPERVRKLQAIHRQAMRAHEMISDLMLFARPPKLVVKSFDLGALTARVVSELAQLAEENSVQLKSSPAEFEIELHADETQIGVALQAVVKNAIEAAGHGGTVQVAARPVERDGEDWVEVCVRDDGPGISDQVRRHMFDPFFSGREAGRGLGFGLSKCWRIVTDHGGEVVFDSRQTDGAEICIRLPQRSNVLPPAGVTPEGPQ